MSDRTTAETATVSDVTDLVVIPPKDALSIFTAPVKDGEPHPIDSILDRVRAEIDAFEPADLSTKTSRARIASMAYRVARAKTALDAAGKALADEQKLIPKKIDATRAYAWKKLEAWAAEVRAPLDAWEAAEKTRVDGHTANLNQLGTWSRDISHGAAELRHRLAQVEAVPVTAESCDEFIEAYRTAKAQAVSTLTAALALRERYEAEQAELETLRKDAAERARIEREADERAAQQAEIQARATAIAAAERAAAVAREEKLKAEIEAQKQRAEEAERKAAPVAAPDLPTPDAPPATVDKASVNRAALDALVKAGIEHDIAKRVVILIAMGKVPRVTINYGGDRA